MGTEKCTRYVQHTLGSLLRGFCLGFSIGFAGRRRGRKTVGIAGRDVKLIQQRRITQDAGESRIVRLALAHQFPHCMTQHYPRSLAVQYRFRCLLRRLLAVKAGRCIVLRR